MASYGDPNRRFFVIMCGIVGFVSNDSWLQAASLVAFRDVAARISGADGIPDWSRVTAALEDLRASFEGLGSFAVHRAIATNDGDHRFFADLGARLGTLHTRAATELATQGRTDELERAKELLADFAWQIERELLSSLDRVAAVMPGPLRDASLGQHYVAWSVEQVLAALDKLEVRGRDSAGIAVVIEVDSREAAAKLERRLAADSNADGDETAARQVAYAHTATGSLTARFVHRVANLVGRLGDNGAALRSAIKADRLLWSAAADTRSVNLLSHTRWASNGIINVPNCHPVDGCVRRGQTTEAAGRCVSMVLNGDVDNYATLVQTSVEARGVTLHPRVSTDAKILPVLFALDTERGESLLARLGAVIKRSHGSLATVLQHLEHPRTLLAGQKGSGQALYLGALADGWLVASEVYGLANLCRTNRPLNDGGEVGLAVELTAGDRELGLSGVRLADGSAYEPKRDTIQIYSRDIFRGDFRTYIEKEVAEAPNSVEKTLAGKFRQTADGVEFLMGGFGNGDGLRARLRSRDRPPIRRVIVIGMGTAAIAGMGAAHFIRQSLAGSGIVVTNTKACELFGFTQDDRLDDAIVVAVSQSGTTTDTNRVVDMARERGAWIHAIVNRRNSALVHKSDSVLYTSDGRDVEMSVASTKAFYSQVAAGKLLGLLLGSEIGTLPPHLLREEIDALEQLPRRIRTVLKRREQIFAVAAEWAPRARNWAIVGNGANRVAAEEIRIKLSELCYKGIPCDVTEDKKHIDLSTEPLTLVIANDLSEMVVQDTVKEVSIFKAHNGRPLVVCADGETRFDGVAQATLPVPTIGGGLGFVVATVVGHLFGIAAARAIDQTAIPFREVRAVVSRVAADPTTFAAAELLGSLDTAIASVEAGRTDSALPPRLSAQITRYLAWLAQQVPTIPANEARLDELAPLLNEIVEELTRPLDTIRHQAKTVTVGISRPGRALSPLLLEAFANLEISLDELHQIDREVLEIVSPLLASVAGGLVYEVAPDPTATERPAWTLRATRGLGRSRVESSKYRTQQPAMGSKRRVLRTGVTGTATGARGDETLLIVPLRNPTGNVIGQIALLHVDIVPTASLSQKKAALQGLHNKHDDLVEELAERRPGTDADQLLQATSPRTLLFEPVLRIVVGTTA
ncbi:MAG: SIS domain-containing protein [Polyangiaceae bacterium]|nr:SIS domain-containing protein [Polyangiaceae bacterium]